MPILEFEASAANGPAPKKPLKLILGAGVLVGALALGSTLAASINLSGGGPIEFGQGVVAATACDPDITVTPFSTFINATGGGEHRLSSIRLSGIDSSDGACEGKTFRIRAYGDGPDPLDLFEWEERDYDADTDTFGQWSTPVSYDFVDIKRTATDFLWTSGGTDLDDVINIVDQRNQADLEQTAFTLKLVSAVDVIRRTPLVSTDVLKKITVESRDTVDAAPASYAVGDEGPGGGIIFYVSTEGFNCGPDFNDTGSPTSGKCNYLEAAPNTWNGFEDPEAVWCEVNSDIATSVELGAGNQNTLAMLAGCSSGAANMVAAYNAINGGGKSDWFLGSQNEFAELYKAQAEVGGWRESSDSWGPLYWTSTHVTPWLARCFYIYYPHGVWAADQSKDIPQYVRPIRAF